jgi:hypothetical protein
MVKLGKNPQFLSEFMRNLCSESSLGRLMAVSGRNKNKFWSKEVKMTIYNVNLTNMTTLQRRPCKNLGNVGKPPKFMTILVELHLEVVVGSSMEVTNQW